MNIETFHIILRCSISNKWKFVSRT